MYTMKSKQKKINFKQDQQRCINKEKTEKKRVIPELDFNDGHFSQTMGWYCLFYGAPLSSMIFQCTIG